MNLELVKKFKDIFTGLERAHGVFEKSNEPQNGKKVEARMKNYSFEVQDNAKLLQQVLGKD